MSKCFCVYMYVGLFIYVYAGLYVYMYVCMSDFNSADSFMSIPQALYI